MTPEEILKNRGIKYKYSAADLVVHCMNPDHEDNNPSMRIDKFSGKFNCLSCGFSGNIYSLFNIHRNITDVKVSSLLEKIRKINKQKLYIPLGAEKFSSNYRDISSSTFEAFEAFTMPGSKEWDGRIVFPIKDINGDIICFQGRYLYSKLDPKYLTKPEGVNLPMFPASPDIIEGSIILVEGLFDMLKLYDNGLTNAVATFGVTLVSKSDRNNVKLKKRLSLYKMQGVTKIYILFDGDKAGRSGAKALFEALKDTYVVEILDLPEDSDPGSLSAEDINSLRNYLYGTSSSSRKVSV